MPVPSVIVPPAIFASVIPYPCKVVGFCVNDAKECECADGLNSFGLPVISFQAYEGFVAALAQAGTSLAGIEAGLFLMMLQSTEVNAPPSTFFNRSFKSLPKNAERTAAAFAVV